MFKEHKKIKDAVTISQHTQRNWDLSKSIPEEDIELLVHAVTQCPSKQNFSFYKVHVITNRDLIEKIHEHTMGLGYAHPETGERVECTNSQVLANALFIFEENNMSEEYWKKWEYNDFKNTEVHKRDIDMAVGIASGYLNVIATMLGYRTGCCACYDQEAIKEVVGMERPPILMMGVGYQDLNRQRREHHTENVMINRRIKEDITVEYIK